MKRTLHLGEREAPNAERDCHRKFARLGFSLPIAIQSVTHQCGKDVLTTNWVKVSDWLKYLLRKAPSVLAGSHFSVRQQCVSFWQLYRQVHAGHVAFESGKDLNFCLPLILYGDEGRGPKRANFMDFTFETPFGLFRHQDPHCVCREDVSCWPAEFVCCSSGPVRDSVGVAEQCATNQKGHSYLTKHLVFGLPSFLYKAHPQILQEHLRLVSADMRALYEHGIEIGDSKEKWWGILIGVKGDMKFHAEVAGGFNRSYATLSQKGDGKMCSLCLAGDPRYEFEEVDHVPSWAPSMFEARPWPENDGPALSMINYDPERPEWAFKLDAFHVFKVGLTRHIVGSLVMILCRLGFFDSADPAESRDINERLNRAHGGFKLWCAGARKSPGLRSFTRSFFNCKTFRSSAWANSKGSDSTLLVSWLLFYIPLIAATHEKACNHLRFFNVAKTVLENLQAMHKICDSHGLWMPRVCGQNLYARLMLVCKGYNLLAKHGILLGMVAYLCLNNFWLFVRLFVWGFHGWVFIILWLHAKTQKRYRSQ